MQLRGREGWGLTIALAVAATLVVVADAAGGAWLATRGSSGGSNSSSASLDRSFRPPEAYTVGALAQQYPFRCGHVDAVCAADYLTKVTKRYGPRASLGLLERLYAAHRLDPSVNDHALAHVVGRETAARFGSNFKSFNLCPIVFNYGCTHGFFEYVLGRTDTPRKAAAAICENVSPNQLLTAGFNCYHGVGHGVMMAAAYDLHKALKVCNTLGRPKAEDGCWQGVFMENVNAGMRGQARTGVFSRKDSLAPCDRVAAKYRYECYINHAGWLMVATGDSVERASRDCMRAAGFRKPCLQSIGLMVTNPVWQAALSRHAGKRSQAAIAWELCLRFPAAGRKDCVIAAVDNLANFDNLNVRRAAAFCALATGLQAACYRQIGFDLRARTSSRSQIAAACARLPAAHRRECLVGANLTA